MILSSNHIKRIKNTPKAYIACNMKTRKLFADKMLNVWNKIQYLSNGSASRRNSIL
uniref:Uncharacterized protein n=1 Tax=Rhizophora mucronata TaxID=61149 RepID=A0A2P2NHV4_RHIMU